MGETFDPGKTCPHDHHGPHCLNYDLPHARFGTYFYGKTIQERMILNGPPPYANAIPESLEAWLALLDREGYQGEAARQVLGRVSRAFGADPERVWKLYQELDQPVNCRYCGQMFFPFTYTRDEWINHRRICELTNG